MAEFDSAAAVFKSRPKSLARLMEVGVGHPRLWRPDELAAIFRHQMSAPVLVDLGGFDPGTAVKLKTLSEAQGLLLKNFADLFRHPAPPLELLELTKDFAKANLDHPESSLPNEIATALYYTSIASALVRLDKRISHLGDDDLRHGLIWAKQQAWIGEEIQGLLASAIEKIPSPEDKSGQAP
jgi:hypothetical protein